MFNQLEYVNEAYIGKNQTLLQCEELLDEIIIKSRKSLKLNINKLSENKKFEQLICKQFGFKGFTLYWTEGLIFGIQGNIHPKVPIAYNPYPYTLMGFNLVQTLRKEDLDFLRKNYEKGFYDYDHKKYCIINISSYMVNSHTELTGEHLMAMIMHEIGHNFSTSLFNYIKAAILLKEDAINTVISGLLSTNKTKGIAHNIMSLPNEIISMFPEVKQIWYVIQKIFNTISDFFTIINAPFIISKFATIPINLLFTVKSFSNKRLEVEADSFATSYGYGEKLVEALDILSTHGFSGYNPNIKDPLASILLSLSDVVNTIFADMFGDHPSNISRAGEQLLKLKRDLGLAQFDPKLENELEEQIESLEYIVNNYNKAMNHENFYISEMLNSMYSKMFKIIK